MFLISSDSLTAPGVDHPWTVGTKLRQQRMHEPAVCTPVSLRNVLLDDCRRRHYILDADVPKQAKSQSFVEEPAPNQEGTSGQTTLFDEASTIYSIPWL